MTPFALAAGLLLAGTAHATEAGPWSFELASERHSDPLPLAALDGAGANQLRPRSGRNIVYVEEAARASRHVGAWRWSLLARQSATIVANDAALRLAQQVDGAGSAASARWQADARFRALAGAGAEVARPWPLAEGWTLDTALQALVLGRWRERTLSGAASFDAATAAYRFDLRTARLDDHADEPFQQPFAAHGQALLASLGLRWQQGPWQARIALEDLGWLHWRGLPQQEATLSTDTQATDADGFVVYRPLVQGRNGQAGLTRSAPLRGLTELAWQAAPAHRVSLVLRTRLGMTLPAVAWQSRWQTQHGALQAGAQWHLHERRLTLHARWQGWQLRLGTDRLGAGAQSRELGLVWAGAL